MIHVIMMNSFLMSAPASLCCLWQDIERYSTSVEFKIRTSPVLQVTLIEFHSFQSRGFRKEVENLSLNLFWQPYKKIFEKLRQERDVASWDGGAGDEMADFNPSIQNRTSVSTGGCFQLRYGVLNFSKV